MDLIRKHQHYCNCSDDEGNTPLHFACMWGHKDFVKYILDINHNIDYQNKYGDSPLHKACESGHLEIVKMLVNWEVPVLEQLAQGAAGQCNPSRKNRNYDTPLHYAAKGGFIEVWDFLTSLSNYNLNAINKDGFTPLHVACLLNRSEFVSSILKSGRNDLEIRSSGNTLLHAACQGKASDTVKVLLEKFFTVTSLSYDRRSFPINSRFEMNINDKNQLGYTALHYTAKVGDVSSAELLLSLENCNPNLQDEEGDTPIHIATRKEANSLLRLFISDPRCDFNIINKNGETAIHILAETKNTEAWNLLKPTLSRWNLQAQNISGNTALHIACYNEAVDIMESLLERRCSTNIINKEGDTAQSIPLADGNYLIHFACIQNDVELLEFLIFKEGANPNLQNLNGETPLHFAVSLHVDNVFQTLMKVLDVNPNIQNEAGNTPLHAVATSQHLQHFRALLDHFEQCNVDIQNGDGNTVLHVAAESDNNKLVELTVNSHNCNFALQNNGGDTAAHIAVRRGNRLLAFKLISDPNIQNSSGDTLLHIATRQQDRAIAQVLLEDYSSNANIQNSSGETPLHLAANAGKSEMFTLILHSQKCDLRLQNCDGDTPLHTLCRSQNSDLLCQCLSRIASFDVNLQNGIGDTPLHIACKQYDTELSQGNAAIVSILLKNPDCGIMLQNAEGNTPLHTAVKEDFIDLCEMILGSDKCKPEVVNMRNSGGNTALNLSIARFSVKCAHSLLQHKWCDPTLPNNDGNTPLHTACLHASENDGVCQLARLLISNTSVNLSSPNLVGKTPIELTTNYNLIEQISNFHQCKRMHAVETFIKIFVVGNPSAGKSTLVEAICQEASGWRNLLPAQLKKVKAVPSQTAGISSTQFQSKRFGNTIMFDLAGQYEYYSSHSQVIQSTVLTSISPPAFLVVVDLRLEKEETAKQLKFWWSFIDNHVAKCFALAHVIIIGSHADVLKSRHESTEEKLLEMASVIQKLQYSFQYSGLIAINCRQLVSSGLKKLCSILEQSCTTLRTHAEVDLRCHALYSLLLQEFKEKAFCSMSEIADVIKKTDVLLPQSLDQLYQLLSVLSDRGVMLLIGSQPDLQQWVILQKEILLQRINGTLFAPEYFREHKAISLSTGVVPLSKLRAEFADYDVQMLVKFMVHFEHCFEIEDKETLSIIQKSHEVLVETDQSMQEEYYYFFPALVRLDAPTESVWQPNEDMQYKIGWMYKCTSQSKFLTSRFLHILILRLAFLYAFNPGKHDFLQDAPVLCRRCVVWKQGIAWQTTAGVEIVMEMDVQCQWLVILMRCLKGTEEKCIHLCSSVLHKVRTAKEAMCPSVQMTEFLIHPTQIYFPLDSFGNLKLYSADDFLRGLSTMEMNVIDQYGRNLLPMRSFLCDKLRTEFTFNQLLGEDTDKVSTRN